MILQRYLEEGVEEVEVHQIKEEVKGI